MKKRIKKTFEEDGAEAPKLLGGGIHLRMRAFPSACHLLAAPIPRNRPSSSKEKKAPLFVELKKGFARKAVQAPFACLAKLLNSTDLRGFNGF